jgi:hypothetical protein
MWDWLADSWQRLCDSLSHAFILESPRVVDALAVRLTIAALMGCVVAALHYLTQRPGVARSSSFIATLVILCILIAAVTQIIGNNVARAFSLVGTLAIVRFRTIVEDTRDTAFVILTVVVGMALGSGHIVPATLSLTVAGAAAVGLRFMPGLSIRNEEEWTLQVRIGTGFGDPPPWAELFTRRLRDVRLVSTGSARQGAAFDLSYKVRLKADTSPLAFLKEMNRLEGIQNLELRRTGPGAS